MSRQKWGKNLRPKESILLGFAVYFSYIYGHKHHVPSNMLGSPLGAGLASPRVIPQSSGAPDGCRSQDWACVVPMWGHVHESRL